MITPRPQTTRLSGYSQPNAERVAPYRVRPFYSVIPAHTRFKQVYELTHLLGEARPTPGTCKCDLHHTHHKGVLARTYSPYSPAPSHTQHRAPRPRSHALHTPRSHPPIPYRARSHAPRKRATRPVHALSCSCTRVRLDRTLSTALMPVRALTRPRFIMAHAPTNTTGRNQYHRAQPRPTTTTRTPHTLAHHAPRTRPPTHHQPREAETPAQQHNQPHNLPQFLSCTRLRYRPKR